MNALPPGWTTASLDELSSLITDGTHQTPTYVPSGVPFISTANLKPFCNGFDFSEYRRFITQEAHAQLTKRCYPERGDILISKCGTIGRAKEVDIDYSFSIFVGLALLKLNRGVFYPKFLEYWLNAPAMTKRFEELAPGSTRRTLTLKGIKTVRIPIPPSNEQRRIVAKLEQLLAKVDWSQKRLAKVQILLKRFRQAVLAAACSGQLTADWRETNQDAEPCVTACGAGPLSDGNNYPDNWRIANLGALVKLVTSGSRGWAKYYAKSGAVFVRAQNISSDVLNLDDVAYVRLPERSEGLRTRVQLHDILITITGANVTKSALIQKQIEEAYVNQHVALVRLHDVRFSKFVFLSVISPMHGRQQLTSSAYGQGKPGLNLDNIRRIVLALPPLPEQQEIVRRVNELFTIADQVEARYSNAKQHVDNLKQSILAKAFRGELVPQDPNDEPATVLIERIREPHGTETRHASEV